MTRTHFKAIARMINDNTLCNDDILINKHSLVKELCDYFKLINNRFDVKKFNDACDVSND